MANKLTVFNWEDMNDGGAGRTWEGDVDANVSPNGELLVVENLKLSDERIIKAIYAKGCWERVEVE